MQIKTIRRFSFEHKPLHFGEASETNFEFLSTLSEYDDNGNLTLETKYGPDRKADEVNRFEYNNEGKLMQHEMEMVHEGMKDVFKYDRDENGRLLKEQKFYGDDPGEATLYKYNEKGDVAEITRTDADGEFESREVFTYDDKGNIVKRNSVDEQGKTRVQSVMTYDNSGNLAMKVDMDADGAVTHKTEYSYNAKNAIESVVQRNAEGKLTESVRYVYDDKDQIVEKAIRDFHPRTFKFAFNEKGECIEEMMYDQHGQLNSKSVFEYDEHGNVVRELAYHMDVSRQDLNKGHRYEYDYYA